LEVGWQQSGCWDRAGKSRRGLLGFLAFLKTMKWLASPLAESSFPPRRLVFQILLSMLFAPLRGVVVVPLAFFRQVIAELLVLETSIEPCLTVQALAYPINLTLIIKH
jgi:hypothetical protein